MLVDDYKQNFRLIDKNGKERKARSDASVLLAGVKTVLDNIQIETTHLNGAEVMNSMVQHMEVIAFIRSGNFLL